MVYSYVRQETNPISQLLQEAYIEQPKIEHLLKKPLKISPLPTLQGFLTISIQKFLLHYYCCKVPGSRLFCNRVSSKIKLHVFYEVNRDANIFLKFQKACMLFPQDERAKRHTPLLIKRHLSIAYTST